MRQPSFAAVCALLALAAVPAVSPAQARSDFTVAQAATFPFASDLAAARSGSRIAWVLIERGVRNIYVAEGPAFVPRRVTSYTACIPRLSL